MNNILRTFYIKKRVHRKKRRSGGAGDDECDICFESEIPFDKLNCMKCSDKGSKICKKCAGIIKIQKKNCPMCRGEIEHSFTSLREKIEARKNVEKMENPTASSPRRSASPRRAVPARSSPRRAVPARSSLRREAPSSRSSLRREAPASRSSLRRAAPARSPPRRPAAAPRRPAAAPASRSSPNSERTLRTLQSRAFNRVDASRSAASTASRLGARSSAR